MVDHSHDIEIRLGGRLLISMRGFTLARDRVTFLFGESGIGKSLISRALFGLLDPSEFGIVVNGEPYRSYLARPDTRAMQQEGFFVFQEPSSHLHPLLTLKEQLKEGSLARAREPERVVAELWEGADPGVLNRVLAVYPKPYRPSGGEKQRVLLAMALMKMDMRIASREGSGDAVFVFDEPTGSLDNHHRDLFISLLVERFLQKPVSVLFVTHDYSIVKRVADAHPGLLERTDFKELLLVSGRLGLRDFAPKLFSGWLRDLKQARLAPTQESQVQLAVESGMEVFGRQLLFTRQGGNVSPSSLEVRTGEMVYLKAPSGVGKTTVAKVVMGLLPAKKFQASLSGRRLSEATSRSEWRREVWGKKMTMVFQHADEALNLQSTVRDTFKGLPLKPTLSDSDIEERLALLFESDDVPRLVHKKIWMLSGGQKQKVNLLRALALRTNVLILDEPLNGLDFESTKRVVALLREKQSEGTGLLVISHNEDIFDALVAEKSVYHLQRSVLS